MRIDSIYLRDVGPFDEVTVPFPKGSDDNLADVYLLTGPNGCGKSTVLYAIAAHLGDDGLLVPRMRSATSETTLTLGRSTNRIAPRARNQFPKMIDEHGRTSWAAFAYAGTRELENGHVTAIAEQRDDPYSESLSFQRKANTSALAQWIANQDLKRLTAKEAGKLERAAQLERSRRDIERIVAEIIDDPTFAFVGGYETDIDIRVRRYGMTVDMGLLPDGIKSIVSWVADLLMRLDRIPWIDDLPPLQRSFLLLLDEIEIHLHPEWQRKVIPVVQKLFKNAQIIASTHSPFVVASANDAHIITFAMKDGVSKLESIKPSQIGVSYSAVLRDIFGITSEFDVETEQMLASFHEAKTHLLEGTTDDRATVDQLAKTLAARGEELSTMMGFEMRQIDRYLKKQIAG